MSFFSEKVHDEELLRERGDEELLSFSLSDPKVFEVLVERYQKPFIRKAARILGDREGAQDVVQETFTRIYLYAPGFLKKHDKRFQAWAYTILTNTAISVYRKNKRTRTNTASLTPEAYDALGADDRAFANNELSDFVALVLTKIPAHFSRILTMHFTGGMSYKEIAFSEKKSIGAIKTQMYRAKKVFKKEAGDYAL